MDAHQAFQTIPSPSPSPSPSPPHQTQVITNFGNLEKLMNLINGGNAGQPNINFNPNYDGSGSEEDEDENEDDSVVSVTQTKRRTGDRARMLITERRRWRRMKEKLLALRAVVPNISKMDKASMVGDAVLYVQSLQIQIKKLRAEVAGLELSLEGGGGGRDRFEKLASSPKPRKLQVVDKKQIPGCRKILQMEVVQVGEREFYVRSACHRGEGVAVALYRALESLTCFDVQSSNVTAVSDRFLLTFTLIVRKGGEEMNVSTLKKLVIGALLSQGFELKTPGDP
ncbi:transcription factor FER-LIKE IRON DEFICIENCY-INDUCED TRANSCRIPTION FACTOR-like [Macadamia integrifolia]|uniref:transcription factor FER-LIKE IRON DEFICIENCY-INDUCED TRANSCRIPTION FACTOR-like n=1 Tax=Macadamia integrifolia TaxID=60698 RepID=UPI001C4F6CC2|nr:transcription factor FER-LIKE IRON DEFICIENCY-INDUCED TRANSCRIPTION FACTOR-like [Macadamia integrifolia]